MEIETGRDYLLDGKVKVIALKATNRAKTFFNIEISGKGVESVEKERLKPFPDMNDPKDFFYPENSE